MQHFHLGGSPHNPDKGTSRRPPRNLGTRSHSQTLRLQRAASPPQKKYSSVQFVTLIGGDPRLWTVQQTQKTPIPAETASKPDERCSQIAVSNPGVSHSETPPPDKRAPPF